MYNSILHALITCLGKKTEVDSLSSSQFDLMASTHKKTDKNGKAYVLIKVLLPIDSAYFEGNVIGKVKYDCGEHLVYMPSGKKLRKNIPQKDL